MAANNQIEGKRAVYEAYLSDVPISSLKIANNIQKDSLVNKIISLSKQKGVKPIFCDNSEIKKLSNTQSSQGIIAITKQYKYAYIPEIMTVCENKEASLVVVCDHITDTHNFGAIIRSAESVGASGIIIPNARSVEVNSTVYKTSAGAALHINIARVPNLARAISDFKAAGFWVCAATEHADLPIWDANLQGKIVLVLGNEEKGISDNLLKNCDFAAYLPQMGHISSLNVAQASTVFMYEWLRQN